MLDDHRLATPQVSDLDDLFGTHTACRPDGTTLRSRGAGSVRYLLATAPQTGPDCYSQGAHAFWRIDSGLWNGDVTQLRVRDCAILVALIISGASLLLGPVIVGLGRLQVRGGHGWLLTYEPGLVSHARGNQHPRVEERKIALRVYGAWSTRVSRRLRGFARRKPPIRKSLS